MLFVGIDPGKAGALAWISHAGVPVAVKAMPVIESDRGASEYHEHQLRALLAGLDDGVVAWEKLQALPPKMGGSVANFQRGLAVGLLRGICAGLRLRSVAYKPREWQAEMFAGTSGDDTKQRSVVAATRLFPAVCLVCLGVGEHHDHGRRTKARDGVSDALLIADFARRRFFGHMADTNL